MLNIMLSLISAIIRTAITITLLVFVWLNAHWAVALFITLISIRFEIEDYIKKYHKKSKADKD